MSKTTLLTFSFTYIISFIIAFIFGESTIDKVILMFSMVAAIFSGTLYLDFWNKNGKL